MRVFNIVGTLAFASVVSMSISGISGATGFSLGEVALVTAVVALAVLMSKITQS